MFYIKHHKKIHTFCLLWLPGNAILQRRQAVLYHGLLSFQGTGVLYYRLCINVAKALLFLIYQVGVFHDSAKFLTDLKNMIQNMISLIISKDGPCSLQ